MRTTDWDVTALGAEPLSRERATIGKEVRTLQLTGKVVKKRFGAGSKSDHNAVYLSLTDGSSFKLRIPGGNPFQDPHLDGLVGKSITAFGELDAERGQFLLSNWKQNPE